MAARLLVRSLATATILTGWGTARPAVAGPLDDAHVGGIGFAGPTTGDLTAIYWNPAALALIEGNQALIAASAQRASITVERADINPATGLPGPGRTFPPARGGGTLHPLRWPPGPGGFAAVGAEIGARFTVAVAVHTPFAQRVSFPPEADGEQPARFHLVEADLQHSAITPAIALRVGRDLRLGVTPGFLLSTGRLVFDEDTALAQGSAGLLEREVEDSAAAARYDLSSGRDPFQSSLAFTVGGGALYRRGGLSLGLAYASRPLGTEDGGVTIDAGRAAVIPPGGTPLCPAERRPSCVTARLGYGLPDMLTAGATWRLLPVLELTGIARWLNYSQHERVTIRVVGPAGGTLAAAGVAEQIVIARELRDTIDLRARAVLALRSWMQIAATLRVETAAAPTENVNPAVAAGATLEPALAAAMTFASVRLAVGYAFAYALPVDVHRSLFDPTAATTCVNAGGDLALPACQLRRRGAARPTAAGRYEQHRHALSLAVTARF